MEDYINYEDRDKLKYLLFAGSDYYPGCGVWDLIGFFETVEEAEACGASHDWLQVVDKDTFQPVSGMGA